jgi:hypothetical protein
LLWIVIIDVSLCRNTWNLVEAEKNLLRTHTTAISAQMLYRLASRCRSRRLIPMLGCLIPDGVCAFRWAGTSSSRKSIFQSTGFSATKPSTLHTSLNSIRFALVRPRPSCKHLCGVLPPDMIWRRRSRALWWERIWLWATSWG